MRRPIVAGTVLALSAGLSACSDDSEVPAVEKTATASASPTPSPTRPSTGTLLDLVPPKPVAPEPSADEAGALAFAEHVDAMQWYAYATADSSVLKPLFALDACAGCREIVDAIDSFGDTRVVTKEPVTLSQQETRRSDEQFVAVSYVQSVPQAGLLDETKPEKIKGEWRAAGKVAVKLDLRWDGERWKVYRYRPEEVR